MPDQGPIPARSSHLPRLHLEWVLKKLIEERFVRTKEIALLRKQNEELRILLRSALWEYAQHNGSKVPSAFVRDWLKDRKRRET